MSAELPAPRTILVINVSRIGDTLLVTPALRALARAWPAAQITLLGHPKRVDVLAHLPFLARTGSIDKNRARLRGWLSGKRWDLGLVYGFDKPLVAYALRTARRVVAFRQNDPRLDARLYRCIDPPPFQHEHSALLSQVLTRSLGLPLESGELTYLVTAEEDAWAQARLESMRPPLGRPRIGLQIASFPTKSYRDWPLEHFEDLCARMLERWPDAHFLLLGGSGERSRTEALAQRFPGHASVLAGDLTLRQSAAIMNRLDLYVGVDTGPTHIMGALGRPMIALYHCYSPSRLLAPLRHPCCWAIDLPRAPDDCTPEAPMSEITVDMVWQKVLEALNVSAMGADRATAA